MPETSSTASEQDPSQSDRPRYGDRPELTLPTGYIDPGVFKQYSRGMSGASDPGAGAGAGHGGQQAGSYGDSSSMAATPSGPTQYRFGAWSGPFPSGGGAASGDTATAPDMSRRVASFSAVDLRYPGDQYESPAVQERAASIADIGEASQGGRGTTLPSMSAITAQYPVQQGYSSHGAEPSGDLRTGQEQRTAFSSILLYDSAPTLQTPSAQRAMGPYDPRSSIGGASLGPSTGYLGQDTHINATAGPSASTGLQGLRMGTGDGATYGALPPMSSSDPPSSGSRKREHDAWGGPDSDEDLPVPHPLGHLASDAQPFKRGRGRPKGSKTQTKQQQPAYYSPDDSLPHVGALLDTSAMQVSQYTHMHSMPTDSVLQNILKTREQGGLPITPTSTGRGSHVHLKNQPVTTVGDFDEAVTALEAGFYQGLSELVSRTSSTVLGESSAAAGGNASRAKQTLTGAIDNVKNVSRAFVVPRSITMATSAARAGDPPGQLPLRALSQSEGSSETYRTSRPDQLALMQNAPNAVPAGSTSTYQPQSVLNTDRPYPGASLGGFSAGGRQSFDSLNSPFEYAPTAASGGSSMPPGLGGDPMGSSLPATSRYDALPGLAYPVGGPSQIALAPVLPNPPATSSGGSAYPSYWQPQGSFPSRPPILPPPGQLAMYGPISGGFDAQADSRSRSFALRSELPRLDSAQGGLITGPYTSGPRYSADYSSDAPPAALYQPVSAAADFAAGSTSLSRQGSITAAGGGARQPSSEDSLKSESGRRRRVVHGPWKESEAERLTALVHSSKGRNPKLSPDEVDWDWVCQEFGPSRSRHQILIKATYLGLKPTSTHSSRLIRQKQFQGREAEVPGITPEKLDRIRAEKAAEAAATSDPQNPNPHRLGTMDSLAQRIDPPSRGNIAEGDFSYRGGNEPFARSSLSGYSGDMPNLSSSGQFYQAYPPEQQARPSTSEGMTFMTTRGVNRTSDAFDTQSNQPGAPSAPHDGR